MGNKSNRKIGKRKMASRYKQNVQNMMRIIAMKKQERCHSQQGESLDSPPEVYRMGPYPKYDYNADPKLKQIMEFIRKGGKVSEAQRISKISMCTLKKYYEKYIAEYYDKVLDTTDTENNYTHLKCRSYVDPDNVFTKSQEIEFKEHLRNLNNLFYGLTEKECCILAYQMAVVTDTKMPQSWNRGTSPMQWIKRFKSRHSDLNVYAPNRCSNKKSNDVKNEQHNIGKFYDVLENHLNKNPQLSDSTRIFALGETYAKLNTKSAKNRTSKDDVITICCIVGANGAFLPSVIIQPHFLFENSESLSDTLILKASNGRMTADHFPTVIQHFIKHSNSSPENPSILIMDINDCHLSIEAFILANSKGVNIVTCHPHTSKKLEPLHMGLFDQFQMGYNKELSSIPQDSESTDYGKIVDEVNVIMNTMSSENVIDAFKKSGIHPFDRDLLSYNDYLECVPVDKRCVYCPSRRQVTNNFNPKPEEAEDLTNETLDVKPVVPENEVVNKNINEIANTSQPQRNRSVKMSEDKKGTELDKLKRRMIRFVGRLLKEKKTEEEVWVELEKENGANCRQLWDRMRSLTIKKLKRLFDADDRVDLVPGVARMTLTDWLLYDLVIVHEKIDVIDSSQESNSKVMSDLFSLVQMFSIEGKSGNQLADAWTAATVHYNSKGHQCSPMLMQRRWYQMKELTRNKMYNFWFRYRGNKRLLAFAIQDSPTELQKAIALRYPEIITHAFPDWQERIDLRLVIMPEEFEVRTRRRNRIKPSDDSVPDVVIVEDKVETITVADSDFEFSDDENSKSSTIPSVTSNINTDNDETSQIPAIVQVKSEPQDPDEDIGEQCNTYKPEDCNDRFQAEIERLQLEEDKIFLDECNIQNEDSARAIENKDSEMPIITAVSGAADIKDEIEIEPEEISSNNIQDIEMQTIRTGVDVVSQESIVIDDDDEESIPLHELNKLQLNKETNQSVGITDITTLNQEKDYVDENHDVNMIESSEASNVENIDDVHQSTPLNEQTVDSEILPMITGIASGDQVALKFEPPNENYEEENKDNSDVIMLHDSDDNPTDEISTNDTDLNKKSQDLDVPDEVICDLNFADDGIELADDGIELADDDGEFIEDTNRHMTGPSKIQVHINEEEDVSSKFDLKLLMNPVVYTTKLDEMTIYKNIPLFTAIEKKEQIDQIFLESKPTSPETKLKVNVDIPETNCTLAVNNIKNDIHYEYNHEGAINDMLENQEIEKETENNEFEEDDNLFHNESSNESECDAIEENKKIKLSSNLLQKPRSRSYNSIQLCKNPDFNTRLKRLTVGFFTSARNRVLLSACKPMTIDLSKTFESKLINGTIYLKPSDEKEKIEQDKNVIEPTSSVMPSANPVHSLMDTTNADDILQDELKKRLLQRNKTINLPHISLVRQINQQLLMAEVTPMAYNSNTPSKIDAQSNIQQTQTDTADNTNANQMNTNEALTNDKYDCNSENSLLVPKKYCYVNNISTQAPAKSTNESISNSDTISQSMPDKNKSKDTQKKLERGKRLPNWSSKPVCTINSDSLLTIDTLYKMLNALDPCQEYALKIKKPKSRPQSNPQKQADTTPQLKASQDILTTSGTPATNKNKKRSCCWSRSKIVKLRAETSSIIRLGKHKCDPWDCSCCCKNELEILEMDKTRDAVENLTEVIEDVVRQSRTSLETSQPAVCIVNQTNTLLEPQTEVNIEPQPHLNQDIKNNTSSKMLKQILMTEVPAVKHAKTNLENEHEEDTSKISPTPKIRVYAGDSNIFSKDVNKRNPSCDLMNYTKANSIGNTILTSEPNILTTTLQSDFLNNTETINQVMSPNETVNVYPCTCKSNIPVAKSSAVLLVDGSNTCLQHTKENNLSYTKSSNINETRVYINRKHMTSSARPLYVGKNKIILTNIKRPELQPRPNQNPTALPNGVQIVLLPDGTISYLVDPGEQLTEEQKEAMPYVLQLIQQQIKATGITLPVECPSKSESSVGFNSVSKNLTPLTASEQIRDEDINQEDTYISVTDIPIDNDVEVESTNNKENFQSDVSMVLTTPILDNTDTQCVINNESYVNDPNTLTDIVSTSNIINKSDLQNETNQELNESHTVSESVSNDIQDISESKSSNEVENEANQKSLTIESNSVLESTINIPIDVKDGSESKSSNEEQLPPDVTTPSNINSPANQNVATLESNSSETLDKNVTLETTKHTDEVKSTRKNLFSDLMEMSGICEEDIAPVPEEPHPHPPPLSWHINSKPLEQSIVPLSGPTVIDDSNPVTTQVNEKVHELNSVKSFDDLKYAFENGGLFYKLDLTTGAIAPIKVCIQNNSNTTSPNSKPKLKSAGVIDLTDDDGVEFIEERVCPSSLQVTNKTNLLKTAPKITRKKNINRSLLAPTIRLEPRNERSVLNRQNNTSQGAHSRAVFLTESLEHSDSDSVEHVIVDHEYGKIQDRLSLARRRNINLLRKNSVSVLRKRPYLTNKTATLSNTVSEECMHNVSSDESDDEPLSNVAKKLRIAESEESQNINTENNKYNYRIEIELEPNNIATEPVPTQLVLTGDAINQTLSLNEEYLVSNNEADENSQEDCILGV